MLKGSKWMNQNHWERKAWPSLDKLGSLCVCMQTKDWFFALIKAKSLIMSFEFLIPTCKKTNHTKSLLMSFEFWARLEAQCNQIGEYYCKKPPHCNDEETWAMFISFLSFMQNPIPLCVCVCVCERKGEGERERERESISCPITEFTLLSASWQLDAFW